MLISNDKAQLSIGIYCLLNGTPHGRSLVIQMLFSSWEAALIVCNREGDENCWSAHVFSEASTGDVGLLLAINWPVSPGSDVARNISRMVSVMILGIMKRMQFLWHLWLVRLVPLQLCSRCWQLLRRAETWLISHLVTASSWQMSTACTLSSLWTTSPSVRRNTSSFLCYYFPLDVHVIKILWSDNEMHHLRLFSSPSRWGVWSAAAVLQLRVQELPQSAAWYQPLLLHLRAGQVLPGARWLRRGLGQTVHPCRPLLRSGGWWVTKAYCWKMKQPVLVFFFLHFALFH